MNNDPQAIVVRLPNWIGDAVMATPALEKIRKRFPKAHITAVAPEPIAALVQEESSIDRIFSFKSRRDFSVVSFLRKERFDLGLLLTRSFSSAWQFWRGGVRQRVGFVDDFRRPLLTRAVTLPTWEEHDSITYQRLLAPFDVEAASAPLTLTVREEEKAHARDLLRTCGCSAGSKVLVVNPGAAFGSAKCWPAAYFKEVVQEVTKDGSVTCVCIGDAKSLALIEEITAHVPHAINLCNQTTIRELMGLISIADCLLTNDSGPMHIGAALKTPLLALFGSTNPARTGPVGSGEVVYKGVSCSPCYRRVCNKNFQCMHSITPEAVVSQLGRILVQAK